MLDIELKTCYNMHMMNEQILELAKQAGLKFPSETAMSPVELKFAQLIVAECAEVILKTFVVHNEIDAMHRIRDNVKQHFGVTE